jgi:hypothetical protein
MMQAEHVQVEYIPSPPVNRVVPRCMKNLCPTWGRDVKNYIKKDAFTFTMIIILGVWLTVDTILFGVAYSKSDPNVWLALGVISTIIPAIIVGLATIITTCLYCGKIYRDASEEITLEDHPDLRSSLDYGETDFMDEAFHYDDSENVTERAMV